MKRLVCFSCCLLLTCLACDGSASSGDGSSNTYYLDADGDGYGDPDNSIQASECPSDYVEDGTDCDDSDENINPGLGTCVLHTYYRDADCDGYGDPDVSIEAYKCPSQYVEDNTDCNDDRSDINPGQGNCP